MSEENYKIFVRRFVYIIVTIVLSVSMTSLGILHIFRENYSDEEMLQDYTEVLYGSVVQDAPIVKFDIIKKKKPSVVALGSSRVMQFRADFFRDNDFYTMGGLGSSVDEIVYSWQKIKTEYTPDVVVIGVDPWWFNPNYNQGNKFSNFNNVKMYNEYAFVVRALKDTKIRRQLFHIDEIKEVDNYGERKTVGLNAAVNGDGYRLSDGSYQYGRELRENKDRIERFKSTYERMDRGAVGDRFVWCDSVSYEEMDKFSALLADIKGTGAHLVVFLAPFPHEVYEYMDRSSHFHDYLHAYMGGTETICKRLNISYYNFCDLSSCGASDDETIDGFHGSELAYARITDKMTTDPVFAQYVDHSKLKFAIEHPVNDFLAIPSSR